MRPVRLAVGGVAIAALLAGCSHDTGDLDSPDSPVARWDWDQRSGEEGLLEGNLALIDNCLYVVSGPQSDAGEARTLLAFPRALASWDSATETLTYGDAEYGVGDFVSAGGGWHAPTDAVSIPSTCELGDDGEVMLVQSTGLEPYPEEGD